MAHQSLSTNGDSESPLLLLPAELRNQIYGYVVTASSKIDIITEQQPGLVMACTEIRSECLHMYYATNIFAFAPINREQGALGKLEKWLSRIGPSNCSALREIVVSLHKGTGMLINDPNAVSDHWTSLYAKVRIAGCSSHLRVSVQLPKSLFPSKTLSQHLSQALGGKEAVRKMVQAHGKNTKMYLSIYLHLLKQQHYNKSAFDEYVSRAFASGDLIAFSREFIYYLNEIWSWIQGKDIFSPPRLRSSEGLAPVLEFIEAFPLW